MSAPTELAPVTANGPYRPPAAQRFSLAEIQHMADVVARSRLFPGVESPQAAFALMMVCQAEGLHPMHALKRYHIIEGRISMRADAMLAEFQARGGHIKWLETTMEVCRAQFSHPQKCPDGRIVELTLERFRQTGVAIAQGGGLKRNWERYPDAMLRARCISAGVRMVDPGAIAGTYTPEEVQDFDPAELRGLESVQEDHHEAAERPILPALPPVIDNESGYGRGQYASPQLTAEFKQACRDYIARRNAAWLDYWQAEEIEAKDLIGTPALCGHLFKWALRTQRLAPVGLTWDPETGKQVEKVSTEQRAQYLAILHGRTGSDLDAAEDGGREVPDHDALWTEAENYVNGLAKTESLKLDHSLREPEPEHESQDREPGADG